MHGRDPVQVRVQRARARVHEHHPDTAGGLDHVALLDARDGAAVADDELAGGLGGVQRAREAELCLRRVGACRRDLLREHHRRLRR